MVAWSKDEIRKIAESEYLRYLAFRENSSTYGMPTWIWSVVVNDSLYVRAYKGQSSRWYQAAMRQRAGRITAAGLTKDVSFAPVIGPVSHRIDAAYRANTGRRKIMASDHDECFSRLPSSLRERV